MAVSKTFAGMAKSFLESSDFPLSQLHSIKALAAELDAFERVSGKLEKPTFGIESIKIAERNIKISEETVFTHPFCSLKHFVKKEGKVSKKRDKLLIVAPLSGHFATLLRDTVFALLPHYDVFITDWEDASNVPLSQGSFGLDDYVQYLLDFFKHLGGDAHEKIHVLGVCQPVVPVLIATALTHQLNLDFKPKSMILMGGPVDTRISPTKINEMSKSSPLSFYKDYIVSEVPPYYKGAGRRVCPGFVMLMTFMSMNPDKHFKSYLNFVEDKSEGNEEKVASHQKFYNEYLAVMDLPEEYLLDSVHHCFQEHTLPKGLYEWKGIKIDLSSITQTALLTIEGEHDDISGLGQTKAAHDLCFNIPQNLQHHYQNPDVGHYGIFSGHRWREIISPKIVEFTQKIKES